MSSYFIFNLIKTNIMEKGKFEQPIEETERIVRAVFKKLNRRMNGRDLMFKNKSGDKRYYAILNPAGNIAVHSYDNGYDYLLRENGEIEVGDINDPEKNNKQRTDCARTRCNYSRN